MKWRDENDEVAMCEDDEAAEGAQDDLLRQQNIREGEESKGRRWREGNSGRL